MNRRTKRALAAVAAVTFALWGYHKFQRNRSDIEVLVRDTLPDLAAAQAPRAPASKVHPVDADIFAAADHSLMAACVDNKYGMTEEACVHTIEDRRDRCQKWVIQKFEVQRPSAERMQAIASSYADCVFEFAAAKTPS